MYISSHKPYVIVSFLVGVALCICDVAHNGRRHMVRNVYYILYAYIHLSAFWLEYTMYATPGTPCASRFCSVSLFSIRLSVRTLNCLYN